MDMPACLRIRLRARTGAPSRLNGPGRRSASGSGTPEERQRLDEELDRRLARVVDRSA
ncbi:hypothetical protein [Streptomyces chrestomyceticus]|uniref:hypothetical protein n=1 Tax=Streptomyces chrestomyceticus TaxID=68185 RepID=UPI0012B9992E|nr:hypothetical protein [Streptomyces chrestomyceticus]